MPIYTLIACPVAIGQIYFTFQDPVLYYINLIYNIFLVLVSSTE